MIKPAWVIEDSDSFPDGAVMADFVETHGGIVHKIIDPKYPIVWPNVVTDRPIGYGSVNFILQMVRSELGEGVFDWHQKLRCSNYYHHVYDLLKSKRIIMPFGALRDAAFDLYSIFGRRVFIRPDAAIKEFDGRVVNTQDLQQVALAPDLCRGKNGLVILSEVLEMGTEYRVFCWKGEAVACSSYRPEIGLTVPEEVKNFAEIVAERLLEPVGTLISVDISVSDTIRLIEVNGVNSSGLYDCSMLGFKEAMEQKSIETYLNQH